MDVVQQLRIMRSNHRMYDDYARRTLAFRQAHTPDTGYVTKRLN